MIAPLILLFLAQAQPEAQAQPAQSQGRGAQTTTAPAPAPAPVATEGRGGGRGRGGVSGPGPAIGGLIDETPVITHHSVQVDGKTLNYTATVGQMPLKDSSGNTEAHIFYMAYTLDGVPDGTKRPLTFSFNGGGRAAPA